MSYIKGSLNYNIKELKKTGYRLERDNVILVLVNQYSSI